MPKIFSQLISAQVENLSADPSNLPTGRIWIRTDTNVLKVYDGSTTRTISYGGSSGSASILAFVPDDSGLAPVSTIEYAQKVWKFAKLQSQKLYTVVKVPNSYTAGGQINMRVNIYSPDTSGNILLTAVSTLVRAGTDAFSTITNQRTSTNTTVALSGSADIPRAVTLDLSSNTGTINSVAISAGDLIKVQLFRGTDTAVNEFRFVEASAEVSYS